MLVSITEKCRMGCSHCLDDAKPDSTKFMTRETWERAIDFNFRYDFSIGITGGEPTEHPQFWDFMKILVDKTPEMGAITIMTNGMNLSDVDIDRMVELEKRCKGLIQWQITNVKQYYPIPIDTTQNYFKLKNVELATTIENLTPRGRATLHPEWKFQAKAPQCFNLRSFIRGGCSLIESVLQLRSRMKFCTPQISYDGKIKLGESTLCPAVADIMESDSEITKKIRAFTCDCKECQQLLSKLPTMYRNAIGEK